MTQTWADHKCSFLRKWPVVDLDDNNNIIIRVVKALDASHPGLRTERAFLHEQCVWPLTVGRQECKSPSTYYELRRCSMQSLRYVKYTIHNHDSFRSHPHKTSIKSHKFKITKLTDKTFSKNKTISKKMNTWITNLLLLGIAATNVDLASGRVAHATAFVPTGTMTPTIRGKSLSRPYKICADCDVQQQAKSIKLPEFQGSGVFDTSRIQSDQESHKKDMQSELGGEIVGSEDHIPGPSDVRVALLQSSSKTDGIETLPLAVMPRDNKSRAFLSQFLRHNKAWVDMMMLRHGAILFRGFDVDSAEDVEKALMAYETVLNNKYRGTSPRNIQPGTNFVFAAAEVPSHYPIAQHLEMSFLPAPPRKLFFSALQAPTTSGGETSLADFRKVYQDIPKALRNKLDEKKLRYRRTHDRNGAEFTHDVAAMKGWPAIFGTSDKSEVERIARSENMPLKWEGRNSDVFVSEYVSEPFQLHPDTNEAVWFNHIQVFHWTTFAAELFAAFRRTHEWRFFLHAIGVTAVSLLKYGLLRRKMALDVSFGDGTPISVWEMHQIRKAIHNNTVYNRWQKGDILMIDNFSISHGRQPSYDSGRKIVVAWSDPLLKSNKLISLELETDEKEDITFARNK